MPVDAERLSQIMLAMGAIELLVSLVAVVWVMGDARSRGKSGCLVAVLIVVFQIPGLILWLVFRPEKQIDTLPDPP